MSSLLLVVPPFLKYAAGPLLGPCILASSAIAKGHNVALLDLNIKMIRRNSLSEIHYDACDEGGFVGDHNKPGKQLTMLQKRFFQNMVGHEHADHALEQLHLPLAQVNRLARDVAAGKEGDWIAHCMEREWLEKGGKSKPDALCLSVLFSGQVVYSLAVSIIGRDLWGPVPIVWGGPHVTALRDNITMCGEYGRYVDRFVFGYAEQTFMEMADALASGNKALPKECTPAGCGHMNVAKSSPNVLINFADILPLEEYGIPSLTLPAQTSRGCAYARCKFCTYPKIEGSYHKLSFDSFEHTISQAEQLGANLSLKDSLVTPIQLSQVADKINGRVKWSACTKISKAFTPQFLSHLVSTGCSTLEVGLETLVPSSQQLIDKKQSPKLFLDFLDAASDAHLPLVVNYITGFPHEQNHEANKWMEFVINQLEIRKLHAKLEHNQFELERLSFFAQDPKKYGISITGEWPWSSILTWKSI